MYNTFSGCLQLHVQCTASMFVITNSPVQARGISTGLYHVTMHVHLITPNVVSVQSLQFSLRHCQECSLHTQIVRYVYKHVHPSRLHIASFPGIPPFCPHVLNQEEVYTNEATSDQMGAQESQTDIIRCY